MLFTENRKIIGEINDYTELVELINRKSKNNHPFKNFDNVKNFFDGILSRKSIGIDEFMREWRKFYSTHYPNNGNRHVNYYIVRGYTMEESEKMVSDIQTKVSAKSNRPEVIKKRVDSWKKCQSEIKSQRGRQFYRLKGLTEEEIDEKLGKRNEKWMKSLENYVEYTGDDFHKRKGMSREQAIEKYGKEKAEEFLEKRGTPFENFKKKYGDDWQTHLSKIRYSKQNTIEKYGLEKGAEINHRINIQKFESIKKGLTGTSSKIEIECYQKLGGQWGRQKILKGVDGSIYIFDFYNEDLKILLEFQGDYWHCNPKKYPPDFYHPMKKMYAYEIWDYDLKKKTNAEAQGWVVEYIWESDYKEMRDKN